MKLPTLLLALFIPAALTAADPLQPLRQALTFHASFRSEEHTSELQSH